MPCSASSLYLYSYIAHGGQLGLEEGKCGPGHSLVLAEPISSLRLVTHADSIWGMSISQMGILLADSYHSRRRY